MSAKYDVLSRYALDPTGQTASRRPNTTTTYTTYVVRQGDTLENIATRMLGSPTRYWEIADVNPQIKFPLDLTPGTVMRLPT